MPAKHAKGRAKKPSEDLAELPVWALETELLIRAIRNADLAIICAQNGLNRMREKQAHRKIELNKQMEKHS